MVDPREPASEPAGGAPEHSGGYELARDELVEIVRQLEAGGLTLEESLALWRRGEQLAEVCQRLLDGARGRVAGTAENGSGDPSAQ